MPIVASSKPRAEVLMSRQQQTRIFFPLLFHFPYFFCSFLFSFRTSLSSLAFLHCRSLTGARISYTRRWIAARRVLYFPPSLIVSITPRLPFNVLYKYFHRKNQRIMQRKRFNYSKIDVHNYCTHRPELEIVYTFWNFKKKRKKEPN